MAENVLDQLLFRIEEIECRSLVWGFVDGALSYDEVYQLAQEVAPNENPEDLVEDLIDRRLLFELRGCEKINFRECKSLKSLAVKFCQRDFFTTSQCRPRQ